MTFQRARSEEQREIRRQAILDTAAAMLDEMPVAEVSLNELSRRVGLAKSNVLRYFESREAVLLELLDGVLREWLAEAGGRAGRRRRPAAPGAWSAATSWPRSSAGHWRATRCCATSSARRPASWSTTCPSRSSCATSGPPSPASRPLAELIRRHVPELGDGARTVCLMALVLAGALSAYSRPSASLLAAYEADPAVAGSPGPAPDLESAMATLITGALARTWPAMRADVRGQDPPTAPSPALALCVAAWPPSAQAGRDARRPNPETCAMSNPACTRSPPGDMPWPARQSQSSPLIGGSRMNSGRRPLPPTTRTFPL